jgi:hypothetical protein
MADVEYILGNDEFEFNPNQSYITLEDGTVIQSLDDKGLSSTGETSLLQWEYIAENDDRKEIVQEAIRQAIEISDDLGVETSVTVEEPVKEENSEPLVKPVLE